MINLLRLKTHFAVPLIQRQRLFILPVLMAIWITLIGDGWSHIGLLMNTSVPLEITNNERLNHE